MNNQIIWHQLKILRLKFFCPETDCWLIFYLLSSRLCHIPQDVTLHCQTLKQIKTTRKLWIHLVRIPSKFCKFGYDCNFVCGFWLRVLEKSLKFVWVTNPVLGFNFAVPWFVWSSLLGAACLLIFHNLFWTNPCAKFNFELNRIIRILKLLCYP